MQRHGSRLCNLMFQVIPTPRFQKESKKIVRKYPGFRSDLSRLIDSLSTQPVQGDHLGEGIYKLRISISGKPSGKSYGARIIYAIISVRNQVHLLSVYDKSDKKDILSSEVKEMIKQVKAIKTQL